MRGIIATISIVLLLFACDKKEDQRYIVVSKVKSAAKLATTETIIDKVVLGTQEKKLLGLIKLNKAYFAANTQATILSGVDLTKLSPEDIRITGKRIEIDLPHVEVLNFSYPFAKYEIDSSVTRNAFLNKMDVMDHEKFYMMAELDIRNNLQYTGVKASTENNTRSIMEGILKNLDFEEIYITFKDGEMITPIEMEGTIEN
ncbi:MAG: DUF4230 domain-containing protein [Cyclobacteriaceae bacterium]